MISITLSSSESSDIKYTWLSSSVFQDVINLIVLPSAEVKLYLLISQSGNIVLLTIRLFEMEKFTTLIHYHY
jgi:hypothetical protein